uniref:LRR receptor-like serine/threonine-protein kinase RPK2 n=1 Tax=Tanacetum cinerariifolium TaxID=118510 RepID=A0A6L2JR71_TANCI|nr:LRR receptor-like serine/threonine-protein kinase RPK2 [Tanacetum cinerariifolium]
MERKLGLHNLDVQVACRASEKVDVYSYGVMLLELISGKRALESSFSDHENGYTIVMLVGMLRRLKRSEEAFGDGLWEVRPENVLMDLLDL